MLRDSAILYKYASYTQRPDRKGTESSWMSASNFFFASGYTQRPDRKGTERSGQILVRMIGRGSRYTQRPDRKGTESYGHAKAYAEAEQELHSKTR